MSGQIWMVNGFSPYDLARRDALMTVMDRRFGQSELPGEEPPPGRVWRPHPHLWGVEIPAHTVPDATPDGTTADGVPPDSSGDGGSVGTGEGLRWCGRDVVLRLVCHGQWIGWIGDGRVWRGHRFSGRKWWASWRQTGDTTTRWNSGLTYTRRNQALLALLNAITTDVDLDVIDLDQPQL